MMRKRERSEESVRFETSPQGFSFAIIDRGRNVRRNDGHAYQHHKRGHRKDHSRVQFTVKRLLSGQGEGIIEVSKKKKGGRGRVRAGAGKKKMSPVIGWSSLNCAIRHLGVGGGGGSYTRRKKEKMGETPLRFPAQKNVPWVFSKKKERLAPDKKKESLKSQANDDRKNPKLGPADPLERGERPGCKKIRLKTHYVNLQMAPSGAEKNHCSHGQTSKKKHI